MLIIQNVSKTYPTGKIANNDISFTVESGEVVALVGPNGSGKTTLMQQILGVLSIGEGKILIDGESENLKNIAYVPQFPAVYPALTVYETVKVTTMYLGMPKKQAAEAIDTVLGRTGLDAIAKQPTYTLSGGQKKLLAFATMLVQDAPNLIMDEVTSMVDVVTKELIWKLIMEEKDKGKCILLSSHDLSEVKKLSTKIVVLKDGQVIFSGKPSDVSEKSCHITLSALEVERVKNILESESIDFSIEENEYEGFYKNMMEMMETKDSKRRTE